MLGKRQVELDEDGYMLQPELWTEEVAAALADQEGIDEMTDEQWQIVRFVRGYWEEHETAPSPRLICKEAGVSMRQMYELFAGGPTEGACRIAGLPKPEGCV